MSGGMLKNAMSGLATDVVIGCLERTDDLPS
jgi:hypothetical protein